MGEVNHGTLSAYSRKKCRCDICRSAWNDYQAHRRNTPKDLPGGVQHGTSAGYYKGCRCTPCASARARIYREQRKKQAEEFMLTDPSTWDHGTAETYRKGCRCDICVAGRSDRHRLLEYGMSADEFARRLSEQDGVCAICKRPPGAAGRTRQLFVDHDHATGQVRGLLCSTCNSALGKLGDTLAGVMRAVWYLQGVTVDQKTPAL